MLYIGIDTGDDTGFAVWNSDKRKLESVFSVDFWQCISNISNYSKRCSDLMVIMEAPAPKNVLLNKDSNIDSNVIRRNSNSYISAKRDAILISGYCEQNNIRYKHIKLCSSKWSPAYFRQLTGIKARTSRTSINAVRLVWGM
ncbi:MAG: hypothetical protein EHM58_03235 [Ignavibacteriae bacterium]|nr:MAG: hypothetical protein EHM58_03235 [Ignavibacteriota bacterium]